MSSIPENTKEKITTLMAPMLKQTFFVALSTAKSTGEQMLPHVPDHLEYMNELEAKGLLFASGPFVQPGVLVGDGLTILSAASFDEARTLMENEPLIKLGYRTYELHTWELREGRMMITLDASTSRFRLK